MAFSFEIWVTCLKSNSLRLNVLAYDKTKSRSVFVITIVIAINSSVTSETIFKVQHSNHVYYLY